MYPNFDALLQTILTKVNILFDPGSATYYNGKVLYGGCPRLITQTNLWESDIEFGYKYYKDDSYNENNLAYCTSNVIEKFKKNPFYKDDYDVNILCFAKNIYSENPATKEKTAVSGTANTDASRKTVLLSVGEQFRDIKSVIEYDIQEMYNFLMEWVLTHELLHFHPIWAGGHCDNQVPFCTMKSKNGFLFKHNIDDARETFLDGKSGLCPKCMEKLTEYNNNLSH